MPFAVDFSARVKELAQLPDPPLGEVPVGLPWDALSGAVQNALDRGETHYTDRPGILALRQRVAKALGDRFGLVADPRSAAIITCSVIESRFVALQQIVAAGQSVWAPAELENRIAGSAHLRRATLAAEPGSARLAFLSSSLGETALREYLGIIAESGLILFEVDESAGTFHPSQLRGLADRTVTIGPLGYASWQLGYLITPAALASGLRDFKQALTICSTNLSQWAALAAMESQ